MVMLALQSYRPSRTQEAWTGSHIF